MRSIFFWFFVVEDIEILYTAAFNKNNLQRVPCQKIVIIFFCNFCPQKNWGEGGRGGCFQGWFGWVNQQILMDNLIFFFKDTEIFQKAAFNPQKITKGSTLKIVKTIFL